MKAEKIEQLTSAFQDFTQVIEKFQQTYDVLQGKIDSLNIQLEKKNQELESKISESENIKNFLNNILDNVYTGVLVIDQNGIVTVFNKAAELISGYDKDQIINRSYKSIFYSDTTHDSKSALYTLSTGKESFKRQKQIQTQDGVEKSIEFSTTILRDIDNQVNGVVETFIDISEVKKLQERVLHVETLAALGEMSATVAHEIRNPLAGISGFAGLLDRQIEETDKRKRLVKPIIEGVNRLNNIVSNLLTLTRPQKLNVQKCDLHLMIKDTMELFEIGMQESGKNVKFQYKFDTENPVINCDVQLIQQVLSNIIKNGWEALGDKGKLVVSTRVNILHPISDILDENEKDELIRLFSDVEISIEDNGSGIEEEHLIRIFNPFYTTKPDGNGLGLAICKKIIQLHKGDIHVYSKKNKGTRFVINLPLYENYYE
jgi:PAS domain S-box-containing protein